MMNHVLKEELQARNVSAECDWMNVSDKMRVREVAAMAAEPYWTEQILSHEDAADLSMMISDTFAIDEAARLKAYAKLGALISNIARDNIDSRIRAVIRQIQAGENWND